MAFTNLNLNTQQLLESTFISDMRLIINANTSVVKGKVQDIVNTLEIDLVNKYIGVDNYLGRVKTNSIVLGTSSTGDNNNLLQIMDGTNILGGLSKFSGQSGLTIDSVLIKPLGSIDASSTGAKIAVKKLGVGISVSDTTEDGLQVGSSATSVASKFYGPASFPKQAITHSTEGLINTTIPLLSGNTPGLGDIVYGELKVTKTSKQFIYVSLTLPVGSFPDANIPIYIILYEDSNSIPDPGQTFTVVIKNLYLSNGITEVDVADWGLLHLMSGYDLLTTGKYPSILNSSPVPSDTTYATAIDNLTSPQYITFYNSSVMPGYGAGSDLRYAASVSLTKYGNTAAGSSSFARYIITSSSNITYN